MQLCYVCGHEIKPVKNVSPVYVGNELWRHHRCEPGGAKWLEVQKTIPKSRRSKMYNYFQEALDKTEKV